MREEITDLNKEIDRYCQSCGNKLYSNTLTFCTFCFRQAVSYDEIKEIREFVETHRVYNIVYRAALISVCIKKVQHIVFP